MVMTQKEPKSPIGIDKLLASLEESRCGLEEACQDLERPVPPGVPVAGPGAASWAQKGEAALSSAQGEVRDARHGLLRRLFLRLRDERRRLEETRCDLRAWTEDLRVRYAILSSAEAQLAEQRLRHQAEVLREERRRLDEEKLRFERDRLAEQQRRLGDDSRRDVAPTASVPPPALPPALPPVLPPALPSTSAQPAPHEEFATKAAPSPHVSEPVEALPPPQWGVATEY